MSRGVVVVERPGVRPVTIAAGVLSALLGAFLYVTSRDMPEAVPLARGTPTASVSAPAAWLEVPVASPSPALTAAAPLPQVVVAQPIARPPRVAVPSAPYRYIGTSTTGTETSIVLFGRGRIVTLRGPQPLDDEYEVDAVFDDYLVLRHTPTGFGMFLRFAPRPMAFEPPRNAEDSPRD